jgi:glyoxylase-like metal-dependent hydrolase (beta-lactamase superfamily II)
MERTGGGPRYALTVATTYPVLRWQIGDVRVSRVVEIEGASPGSFFFQDATPEKLLQHAWLKPNFLTDDGRLIASIHAFVIESQEKVIVVDTCVGNDKIRDVKAWNMRKGEFLEDMEEAGFPRERIDYVLCTHLHVDHVGWNTMLKDSRWVPTFPNARYLIGRKEWAYWKDEEDGPDRIVRNDSVRPIVYAGLADFVDADHRITPEVFLEPTPGHTPGHVSVRISSKGQDAVITGDLMHHPVQCAELTWASNCDVDADAARATRREFLEKYKDGKTLVLGTHFAAPTGGRVAADGTAFRFSTAKPG